MIILLLTACIKPEGMSFTTLNNQEERRKQYIDALKHYLDNTNYNIVFTENSNTDISSLFSKEIESGRLECLIFQGNHNKIRGKGYGECEIIQYALRHSKFVNQSKKCSIVKVTGRLVVKNIKDIIRFHKLCLFHNTVYFAINSNLSFPDSRCIIAPKDFYIRLLDLKDEINDSTGYYFEHALLDTIKIKKEYSYSPFLIQPDIEGISGSTGEIYRSPSHTITNTFKYLKYALSLRYLFIRKYRNKLY